MTERVVPTRLCILGFGGHARSVADVALGAGIEVLIFVDGNARPDERFAGFPVFPAMPRMLEDGWALFPASGDNLVRKELCHEAALPIAVLVASTATLGALAEIGEGTFVGHHAHLGPAARVGRGVIVNSGAIIEHECVINDYSHISVGAVVAGRSRIGSNVMVGAGATVIDGISVCDDVVIGAGATVVGNIVAAGTYVGTPARPLR